MDKTFRSGLKSLRVFALTATALLAAQAFAAGTTPSTPTLTFGAWSQVYGQLNNSASDPDFGGGVTVTVNGPSDYVQYYNSPSYTYGTPNGTASVPSWNVGGGNDPGSHGAIYNQLTGNDQSSFSYSGQSQVLGTQTKSIVSSTSNDVAGTGTQVRAWGYAYWQDQWLIDANAEHAAGTFGRLNMSFTLDGMPTGESAEAQLYASTSFTDSLGSFNSSSRQINAYSWESTWTGTQTVTALFLFEYGTAFNVNLQLYTNTYGNSEAAFFDTGAVTAVELPRQAVLQTGALQSGVDGVTYGTVFNSDNPDLIVAGGGGGTPPVPEPETYALMLAGLGALTLLSRRRKTN